MHIFYSILLSAVIGFFSIDLWEAWAKQRARRRFKDPSAVQDKKSIVDSTFRPLFSRYAPLFKRIKMPVHRKNLRAKLLRANVAQKYNEEIFWAFQIFMALLFMGVAYGFALYLKFFGFVSKPSPLIALGGMVVGFFYPHMWLSSLIKKRTIEIIRYLPEFVSTLSLSVEAGLDYFGGIVRYTENAEKSALVGELSKTISEVRLGSSRESALRNMADRVPIQPVRNFAAVLIQATNLGTSISQVLKAQAEKLRRERFERAEKAGAMASQKILFPLVFFIMPAVFLLIFGPLVVKLFTGGLESLF